jgi:hypothetical protein
MQYNNWSSPLRLTMTVYILSPGAETVCSKMLTGEINYLRAWMNDEQVEVGVLGHPPRHSIGK